MKKIFQATVICSLILLSVSSYSQSGWYALNLNPGIASLNSVHAFSSSNCLVFSSYTDAWSINYFKVYKTTNNGISWDTICFFGGRILLTVQFIDNLTGFAGGGWNVRTSLEDDNGLTIYKTTNGGFNWNTVFDLGGSPFPYQPVTDIYFLNANTGWACCLLSTIYRTTNGGQNFISSYTTPVYKKYGIHFTNQQEGITIGDSGYISYTTNGGANWTTPSRVVTSNLRSVYFVNQNTGWIAGFGGNILKTTNGGVNWTTLNTGIMNNLSNIYFYNSERGWAAGNNVVLATTNGGNTWSSQTINPATNLNTLSFSDSLSGWVCGSNKIFNTITGGWVGIKKTEIVIPKEFVLYQNYPNPFNPTTVISFQLSVAGQVVLKVYDALGREVATLVNETLQPGTYEVDWNASAFPGGVYFYKLQAEDFTDTKKLILLK